MAKIRASKSGGGGINADWITPTYSNNNKTISCTWDYDADCVVLIGNTANLPTCWYIPVDNNNNGYSASTNASWHYTTISGVTMDARSLTIAATFAFSNVSVMPIPSKPTLYS